MNNLIKISIIIIITNLSTLKSFGQTTHQNYEPRFSIEIPEDWTLQKPKGSNMKLIMTNNSGSSVKILVLQDSTFKNYDSYDLEIEDLTKNLNNLLDFKVLSFERSSINSKKAVCLKSQFSWQNVDQNTTLVSAMYVSIHNDKMYYITCTSDQLNFKKNETIFKNIVSSFVFKEDSHEPSQSFFNAEKYTSSKDNFQVNFKGIPNINSHDDMTTYSLTSIEDYAIYRITTNTCSPYISDTTIHEKYEVELLNEYKKKLNQAGIIFEDTIFKNKKSIIYKMQAIVYGEDISFGEKVYNKIITFYHLNKVYTISTTSTQNSLEYLFNEFIKTFKFIH